MTDTPLITIGITCHDAAGTVARAVGSALAQNWKNFEIVIVDDASTDGASLILQSLAAQHPRIRVLTNIKNGGVAVSRNRIVEEARGEFIVFFDDDDESVPERLYRQYRRITDYERKFANGAFVICHTARTQSYPYGVVRYEPTMGTDENVCAPHGEAVAERILTGRPVPGVFGSIATCSQMARTEIYRDLGGFDPAFRRGEDTDLNIRAALKGAHFVGISDPLVIQTMTLTGDKKLDEECASNLRLLKKYQVFVSEKLSYSFCCRWIEAKYDFIAGRRAKFMIAIFKLLFCHPAATLKRAVWALPNIGFNVRIRRFYNEAK